MAEGDKGRERDESGQRVVPASEVANIVSERLNSEREKHDREIAKLREEIAESRKAPPKTYNRAELEELVGKGRLTKEQANEIHDKQLEQRVAGTVVNKVSELMTEQTRDSGIQSQIDQYKSFDAELNSPGSPAYKKVQDEVKHLMNIQGIDKPSKAMELVALRTVYGPAERLKEINTNELDRSTHQDVRTGGQMKHGEHKDADTPPNYLSADEKKYYGDLISKGIYTDWTAVHEEQKFANPGLRARAQARNR